MKGGGGGGQLGFGKVSLQEGSAPIYKLSIALPRGGGLHSDSVSSSTLSQPLQLPQGQNLTGPMWNVLL